LRRRFFELASAGPAPIASEAFQGIGELYRVETEIREFLGTTIEYPQAATESSSQRRDTAEAEPEETPQPQPVPHS
jgi:transposase